MPSPSHTPLLSAQALSVTLPGDEGPVRVLEGIDFQVTAGEVVDVVGPSGSGKTTLLRALARLLPQVSGALALEGVAATDIAPQLWRSKVALLPQKPALVMGTVQDNLTLPWRLKVRGGAAAPDGAALRAALDAVGMAEIALDRDASRLSVGQQARLALTRVTLTQPRVLLLDEADAALDDASAQMVSAGVSAFAEAGGAVVRVRHRGSDGVAGRRLHLEGGHLAEVTS